MSASELDERLRKIGDELLAIAKESGCDLVCVKVNRKHSFVNAYAFSGDTRVSSIVDWEIAGDE